MAGIDNYRVAVAPTLQLGLLCIWLDCAAEILGNIQSCLCESLANENYNRVFAKEFLF